jgi:hypothetical protein
MGARIAAARERQGKEVAAMTAPPPAHSENYRAAQARNRQKFHARIAAENPVRIHLVLSHLYREAFPAVIAENVMPPMTMPLQKTPVMKVSTWKLLAQKMHPHPALTLSAVMHSQTLRPSTPPKQWQAQFLLHQRLRPLKYRLVCLKFKNMNCPLAA